MHDFFMYLGFTYAAILLQMLYTVHFIISSFKTKKKKVLELINGFSPEIEIHDINKDWILKLLFPTPEIIMITSTHCK